ncbi:hypothetical protein SAMN05443667_1225 [Flavobacterium gillisiae]|uniref:Helix-turn-helix domain-containing protein n=1 Tax=Flavobacterium gillisiae TaxID=150146 RepID=A0A1H4GCL6_9FLAO|nr:hypothetical protein [Flavobacterium gillisiae]SEB07339.1 hypothetical protein SAMN05443667_1225 [Flavobacterium gillisiae]
MKGKETKELPIQKKFNDALYWATSTLSKDKEYHITRTLDAVLRKLIHYSNTNEKITYSNSIIAEHTFMGEETIKKAIPELRKKNYVSIANTRIFDEGKVTTRRTINIKWDKIESILGEVPKSKTENKEVQDDITAEIILTSDLPEVVKTVEPSAIPIEPIVKSIDVDDEVTVIRESEFKENKQVIPRVVITDEKLKWAKSKYKDPSLTKDSFESFDDKDLSLVFYGVDGIMKIDDANYENKHLIKLYHQGGSYCKLSNLNKKNTSIRVNYNDLMHLLKQRNLEFGDFNEYLYQYIAINEIPKKPKNDDNFKPVI